MTRIPDFIKYVVNNYSPDEIILEIGAGYGSTKTFSEYFHKMYSVENNHKYCNLYHDNYLQVDLAEDGWYDSSKLELVLPDDYTILILDGPLGGCDPPFIKKDDKPFRSGFFRKSWDLFKKDVPIIVDDTDRDWHERDVVSFLENNNYECEKKGNFHLCLPR